MPTKASETDLENPVTPEEEAPESVPEPVEDPVIPEESDGPSPDPEAQGELTERIIASFNVQLDALYDRLASLIPTYELARRHKDGELIQVNELNPNTGKMYPRKKTKEELLSSRIEEITVVLEGIARVKGLIEWVEENDVEDMLRKDIEKYKSLKFDPATGIMKDK